MERVGPALLLLIPLAALFILFWLGWRNRMNRQSALLPELPAVPELGAPQHSFEGQYVTTTTEGDWLDRIAARGLGLRTTADLEIHPGQEAAPGLGSAGVLIRRSGASDLFIPAQTLREMRTEAGMAGKFVERDGIVVVTWELSDGEDRRQNLDTGFRLRRAVERSALVEACQELLDRYGSQPGTATASDEENLR
ncbi:hypothetical protein ODZ83_09115 [Acaricomes phytoseiuli]|uniref:PH-like domain-containing protein n=1 Tax=Acaricomes phytoseiuli TaxID=291968 RepID=UPI000380BFFA|nr:hypothetical protein [Acaricomes phytoseiuli]MCW1250334.1 hypothetical protein [Acaricomes phytoseiuli]